MKKDLSFCGVFAQVCPLVVSEWDNTDWVPGICIT